MVEVVRGVRRVKARFAGDAGSECQSVDIVMLGDVDVAADPVERDVESRGECGEDGVECAVGGEVNVGGSFRRVQVNKW